MASRPIEGIKELRIELEGSSHMVGAVVKGLVVMERSGCASVIDVNVGVKGWITMKEEGFRDEEQIIDETIIVFHGEPALDSIIEEDDESECEETNSKPPRKEQVNPIASKITKLTKNNRNKMTIKNNNNTKISDNRENNYNKSNKTLYNKDNDNIETYPFSFPFPLHLPPSLEVQSLNVRYIIETMVLTSNQYLTFFDTFRVATPNLDYLKEKYRNPIIKSKHSPSGLIHCCIGGGRVGLRVELNAGVFWSGERMKVSCVVDNHSHESVMFFCQLHQIISFQRQEITRKSSTPIWQPPITLFKPHKTHHRTFTLTIPTIPSSFVCPLVNLQYLLKVGLLAEGSTRNVTINLPIIITTNSGDNN